MKRLITGTLCLVVMGIANNVHAQWQGPGATSGTGLMYYTGGNVGIGAAGAAWDLDIIKQLPYIRIHSTVYHNNPNEIKTTGGIIFGQDAGDKTAGITGAVPPGYHVPGIMFSTKTSWSSPGPGTTQWDNRMFIHPSGNVGINQDNPAQKLHVTGKALVDGSYPTPTNANASDAANYVNNHSLKLTNNDNSLYIAVSSPSGSQKVFMQSGHWKSEFAFDVGSITLNPFGGNVGIGTGTFDPDARLAVKGQIHAQEVKIDMNGWADYVFKSDYKLMPLSEVEKFVKKNSHLPDLPSADEVKRDGHKLGEMDVLLLKKIEELTLHLIQLEKEINELKTNDKPSDDASK